MDKHSYLTNGYIPFWPLDEHRHAATTTKIKVILNLSMIHVILCCGLNLFEHTNTCKYKRANLDYLTVQIALPARHNINAIVFWNTGLHLSSWCMHICHVMLYRARLHYMKWHNQYHGIKGHICVWCIHCPIKL